MRRPDFFIVGAPKCGTTALYNYLRQHPQVFMPFVKEPHYFGADLSSRYGRYSEEQYLALFAAAGAGQRVGEASTWYLYSKTAAREIHAFAPDAQIVITLRNPVDVMHAQHSQLLFNRQEDITDFAEALAAETERRAGRRLPPGPIRLENLFYRDMAGFADQVARYIDTFGRARVHIILYDDLRADPAAVYREALRFLAVNEHFQPDLRVINENRNFRHAWLQRLIYDPPTPLRQLIPIVRRQPLVRTLRDSLLRMNSRRMSRPPIPVDLRDELQRELADEVNRLSQLIGRDLSAWSSGEAVVAGASPSRRQP